MSKFNEENTMRTKNISGHAAYKMNDKDKLVTQVLTSFFKEPKYYGDNSNDILDLLEKVAQKEPEFIYKLGLFARYEFNMRSISHVIAVVLANKKESKPYARKYISKVCRRADDMTEILACYLEIYGKPIPNSLKKGLVDALRKFDEYSLAKYDRNGNVKLRDIIQIAHPVPEDKEQELLWKKVLERNLKTPLTWETELSSKGNNKETWEHLIEEDALGYMAMLRNMRNVINAEPNNIDDYFNRITDEKRIINSRVLPFRFYSAYNEIKHENKTSSKVIDVLESALKTSISNIKKINGKTLIAIDVSGSMTYGISRNSSVSCADIACLIGAIANKICEDAIVLTFDTETRKYIFSTESGILQTVDSIDITGGGTDINLPFIYLLEHNLFVDRVILLSDNEVNNQFVEGNNYRYSENTTVQQTFDRYKKQVNPNVWVHGIDLEGYGTQQFIGRNTNIIAGWSEKVLDFISLAEEGIGLLVHEIEYFDI